MKKVNVKKTKQAKNSNLGRSDSRVPSYLELFCTEMREFSSLDGVGEDYTLNEMIRIDKSMAIHRLSAYLLFYVALTLTESSEADDELLVDDMVKRVSPFLLEATEINHNIAWIFVDDYISNHCKSDVYTVSYKGMVCNFIVDDDEITISYGISESMCRAIETHRMLVSKIKQDGV